MNANLVISSHVGPFHWLEPGLNACLMDDNILHVNFGGGKAQRELSDVITTPKGSIIARKTFAQVMSGALGCSQKPKLQLALPRPEEAAVTAIAPKPQATKQCREVSEFIDFMRPFASKDKMAYLEALPSDHAWPFFDTLSKILFTHPSHYEFVDIMIQVMEVARYEKNAVAFASLRYSGLDVSYAQSEQGENLPETAVRQVEDDLLDEAKRTRGSAASLLQYLYLRPHTVFGDYDKLHLIVGLTYFLNGPKHVFRRVQERIEEAVDFLVRDIQSRTPQYKEALAGLVNRQYAVEQVVGRMMYVVDHAFVRRMQEHEDGRLGVDIPRLLKVNAITAQEKEIVIAEIEARLGAGLTSYLVRQELIQMRVEKLRSV